MELDRTDLENDDARFLVWKNTVIVKASNLSEAHDKVTTIGREHTAPYKGGTDGIDVQWQFEGVIQLRPIYEELEDGSELMWAERRARKLKNIRAIALTKREAHQ